jgi:hypothetical protein
VWSDGNFRWLSKKIPPKGRKVKQTVVVYKFKILPEWAVFAGEYRRKSD